MSIGEILNTISSFSLIDPAHAQAAGGAGGFDFMGLLPLVVIFVAFYFFLIRPQQQKAQQQKQMLSAISKGDRVVTAGGILGKVHSIENESEAVIEVEDGVRIRILKSAMYLQFLRTVRRLPRLSLVDWFLKRNLPRIRQLTK
jgi:preprotein translocase subunit YajC